MKENENNELQADALESVAGGGEKKYSKSEVKAVLAKVDECVQEGYKYPSGSPERTLFWRQAYDLSEQAKKMSENLG